MTTYVGKDGIVKSGSNTVGECRSFNVDAEQGIVDDTVMGDTWTTHQNVFKSWSGQISALWDPDDAGQGDMTVGASITLNLYPEGSTSGDVELTGTATVTTLARSQSHDGLVEITMSFTGNGALTEGTVA